MFDPSKFSAPKKTSLTLCNSAHPMANHMPMTAKLVPGSDDVYYVVSNNGEWCATIDTHTDTLGVYGFGLNELKRRWKAKEFLGEVVDIPESDKDIANQIQREVTIMKLI